MLKTDAKQHLLAAIEALASHKPYFTSNISEALLKSFLAIPKPTGSPLDEPRARYRPTHRRRTHEQRRSHPLNISLKTVETHRAAVMRKLDLSSSADLVRYAIRNNLVEA